MERDIFANIGPLDHRYSVADPELFERLSQYLSENAYVRYQLQVEAALVAALAARGVCSQKVAQEVEEACAAITPAEVYEEEAITRHNIRALVNCIRRRVSDEAKPFVHLSATSSDIMDTARTLQYRNVTERVLLPLLKDLIYLFIDLARREHDTVQIGRTHGQHAVPITFGFYMAEYISRLGQRFLAIKAAAARLPGKMAGAVGAYNAASLFFADPDRFEKEVLARLGLEPADYSTQIVEPEFLADYVHALVTTLGVLANFGDDIRHLQRSEIREVGESFAAGQVGSSTMPHKRNPWNFEHVKSMWKAFMPRMVTVYADQISEHQRDLTNSASSRFIPEIVAGLAFTLSRLLRVCSKLVVDRDQMEANFARTADRIIAEPLYILLAQAGHPDAHETVKQLTLQADVTGQSLMELVANSSELQPYISRLTEEQKAVLVDAHRYTGIAARRALEICDRWEKKLQEA